MEYNITQYLSRRSDGVERPTHISQVVKDNKSLIQRLRLENKLPIHSGCINSIQWNERGSLILSGSDDRRLLLTDPFTPGGYKVLTDLKTLHRSNIFCALFLPFTDDTRVISCAGDGCLIVSDTTRDADSQIAKFNCHDGTCYKLLPIDAHTFMSCGEDKTVRFYDLREKTRCSCSIKANDKRSYLEPLIHAPRAVTCMSSHPWRPFEIAVGVADSSVYIHDRRMVQSQADSLGPLTVPLDRLIGGTSDRSCRVTSVNYSSNGLNLLASFSSDCIYLFSAQNATEPPVQFERPVKAAQQEQLIPKLPAKKLKRLRLRGDWSDTGPGSRPSNEQGNSEIAQHRPQLHTSLMERMTLVLSQMLSSVPDDVDLPSQLDSENPIESELESLRSGYIQRHRIEPAVNLAYRTGEPSGRIRMTPANELEREDQGQSESEQMDEQTSSSTSSSSVPLSGTCDSSTSQNVDSQMEESQFKDLADLRIIQKYDGHRNSRTMIKEANFWGSKYIMSGSDCGHIFFWSRMTGELVNTIEADKHVVNCVQPHPSYPILASSGIDYDVKIFTPSHEEPSFDVVRAQELKTRNAIMLNETKNTITVPAAFMIRMLSCLSSLGTRGNSNNNNASNNNNSDQPPPSSSSSSP